MATLYRCPNCTAYARFDSALDAMTGRGCTNCRESINLVFAELACWFVARIVGCNEAAFWRDVLKALSAA